MNEDDVEWMKTNKEKTEDWKKILCYIIKYYIKPICMCCSDLLIRKANEHLAVNSLHYITSFLWSNYQLLNISGHTE